MSAPDLASARLDDWLAALAAPIPEPGGGAAAGVVIATGAALVAMTAGYAVAPQRDAVLADATRARRDALVAAEHDGRMSAALVAAFRRQDAVPNDCPAYAGNLGYGPNPKLVARVKAADLLLVVGARLGEATTDGYTLVTPDHPGQRLIHVHPDADELGMTYATDLAICATMAVKLALTAEAVSWCPPSTP